MKIIRKTRDGGHREALLREYFLTASLIGLLKKVGEEAVKAMPARAMAVAPIKVRR